MRTMSSAAAPLPFELDAPLPAELAGRHQGWLTRYRRYPVFSGPWVRGRWRSLGLLLVIACAVTFVPVLLEETCLMPARGPSTRLWLCSLTILMKLSTG